MIKIGIDLALNSCGICIYTDKEKLIKYSTTHHFIKRKMNLHTQMECKALVQNILDKIHLANGEKIGLYIEIGNYGNANMTQKFGILAGMIIATFIEQMSKSSKRVYLIETKLITPNEWFSKFFNEHDIKENHYNALKRDQRKELSMKYSGLKQDDLADAYWIAYYGDKCKGAYDE